jgi:hypothetical protein
MVGWLLVAGWVAPAAAGVKVERPNRTNDLDAGEHRRTGAGSGGEKARTASVGVGLACTHSGPGCGVRMTVVSGPGLLSQPGRPCCRLMQAHAEVRARPVVTSSMVGSSSVRM